MTQSSKQRALISNGRCRKSNKRITAKPEEQIGAACPKRGKTPLCAGSQIVLFLPLITNECSVRFQSNVAKRVSFEYFE